MARRTLLASFLILVVWMLADMLLHNHFLAPLYQQNTSLWRPLNQMNVTLGFRGQIGAARHFRSHLRVARVSANARYRHRIWRPHWRGPWRSRRSRHLNSLAHPVNHGLGLVLCSRRKVRGRRPDCWCAPRPKAPECMSFGPSGTRRTSTETCPNPPFQRYLGVESCPGRTRSLAFALGACA